MIRSKVYSSIIKPIGPTLGSCVPAILACLLGSAGFLAWSATALGRLQPESPIRDRSIRFVAVDVYIDSGTTPLAAWQFELTTGSGDAKIVGVEGGDHPAFKAPPYYDPKALTHSRVIIAAFSTAENLPSGRTRVARIHVQVSGEPQPEFGVKVIVAADQAGATLKTTATTQQKEPTTCAYCSPWGILVGGKAIHVLLGVQPALIGVKKLRTCENFGTC